MLDFYIPDSPGIVVFLDYIVQIDCLSDILKYLNIHKDYEEYIEAKKCILKNQNEKGILVLNYDHDITRKCAKEAN